MCSANLPVGISFLSSACLKTSKVTLQAVTSFLIVVLDSLTSQSVAIHLVRHFFAAVMKTSSCLRSSYDLSLLQLGPRDLTFRLQLVFCERHIFRQKESGYIESRFWLRPLAEKQEPKKSLVNKVWAGIAYCRRRKSTLECSFL